MLRFRHRATVWGVSVLAILVGGSFALTRFDSEVPLPPPSDNVASLLVSKVRSDVSLQLPGTQNETLVDATTSAAVGSTVHTSEEGRAIVESSDGRLSVVEPDSRVVLAHHEVDAGRQETTIEVTSGQVWSRIENVFEQGEFEVRTHNIAAVVRGTSFGVWRKGDTSGLLVTRGSVQFFALDPRTGARIGEGQFVTPGMKMVREGEAASVLLPIDGADKASEWYRYNNGNQEQEEQTERPAADKPSSKPPVVTTPKKPAPETLPINPPAYVPDPTPPTPSLPEPTPKSPTFVLSAIVPATVTADGSSLVTVRGSGFLRLETIVLGGVSLRDVRIVGDSEARFTVGKGEVGPGTHTLTLLGIGNLSAERKAAVTVVEPAPAPPPPPVQEEEKEPPTSPNYPSRLR